MKSNMGRTDRLFRGALAVLVIALYLGGVLSGPVALVLGVLAAVFALTSLVGTCPLYRLFGIDTRGADGQA